MDCPNFMTFFGMACPSVRFSGLKMTFAILLFSTEVPVSSSQQLAFACNNVYGTVLRARFLTLPAI